jgi:hypothetical protein
MKTFNYYYGNQAITKSQFESNVPDNWQEQIVNFEFSWGYYKAVERD